MSNALKRQDFSEKPPATVDAVSVQILYAMGLGQVWQSLQNGQELDTDVIADLFLRAPLAGLLKIANALRPDRQLHKPRPLLRAPMSMWLELGEVSDFLSGQPFSKPTLALDEFEVVAEHPQFSVVVSELLRACPEVSFYCPIDSGLLMDSDIWSKKRFHTALEQLQLSDGRLILSFSSAVALRQFMEFGLDLDAELMLISDLSMPQMESVESICVELARVSQMYAADNRISTWAFRWDATRSGNDLATAEQYLQYLRLVTLGSCLCPQIASIGVIGSACAELFPLLRAGAANYFGFGAADIETAEYSGLPEVRHLRSLVEQLRQKELSDETS